MNTNRAGLIPTPTHRLRRSDKRLWAEIRDWIEHLSALPDRSEREEILFLGLRLVKATGRKQKSLVPDMICELVLKSGFGQESEIGSTAELAELVMLTGKMLLAVDRKHHTVIPRLACEFAAKFGCRDRTRPSEKTSPIFNSEEFSTAQTLGRQH